MMALSSQQQNLEFPDFLKIRLADRLKVSIEQIFQFCQRWHILELSLFGSVLREDFRPDSDVDILVVFLPEYHLTFHTWLAMQQQIEKIFGRKVDLTQKKLLKNPYTRAEILKTHQVIYAAE